MIATTLRQSPLFRDLSDSEIQYLSHCRSALMTDYSHVVYALSAFALIKRMNCRVFEGCNCRSEPDCPAQVGRTTLGHLHSGAGEVAGLLYSRIDACISSKFGR